MTQLSSLIVSNFLKSLNDACHAVEVGDEKIRPAYCEGKKNIHPSLPACCCAQCCTCGG